MIDRQEEIATAINLSILNPVITVGISPTAEQGVVIAAYSGRYSRMWAWDAGSLKILGYQDIKASVTLCDISETGRLCAYSAIAHSKAEHYVAISRPPYFHALWLRNALYLGPTVVLFSNQGLVRYSVDPKKEEFPWSRIIEERTTPRTPFRFEEMAGDGHREECALRASRCSRFFYDAVHWRQETGAVRGWVGEDHLGRRITVQDWQVLADGVPFLDCSRQPFEAVTTPEWAKSWE